MTHVPPTIESQKQDGLRQLVNRAAAAARGPDNRPIGVLTIELAADASDNDRLANLSIEAEFSARSGSVRRIDVRAAGRVDGAFADHAAALLSQFGGVAFTNIIARTADTDVEQLDVTVSFPHPWLPFYATNVLLESDSRSSLCADTLEYLGVKARRAANSVTPARAQLRSPMTVPRQLRAMSRLLEQGLTVELYAAPLPAVRSIWIANAGTERVQVAVTRGLADAQPLLERDYEDIDDFLARTFSFEMANRHWHVSNVHGEAETKMGVIPQRPPMRWSVNWGMKRDR
jgi:hypothetical protein